MLLGLKAVRASVNQAGFARPAGVTARRAIGRVNFVWRENVEGADCVTCKRHGMRLSVRRVI